MDMYLIWSWKHRAWWAPNGAGYTKDIMEAGRYTQDAAGLIVVDTIPPGQLVGVLEGWALSEGEPQVMGA